MEIKSETMIKNSAWKPPIPGEQKKGDDGQHD